MIRTHVRTLLHAYTPPALPVFTYPGLQARQATPGSAIAPEELETKQRMLAFIDQYPNCFERSLAIGHITASAWLINKENTHVLMMHHAKLGIWVQLGGHCDGNPNPLEVALKEAQEESGITNISAVSPEIFDIDIHLVPANSKEHPHYHYDIRFLLQVTSNEPYIQNSESKELRWVSKKRDELPTDQRSITRMFDKWINL